MNKLLLFKRHEVGTKPVKSTISLAKDISHHENPGGSKSNVTSTEVSPALSEQSVVTSEQLIEVNKALENKRDQLRRQRSHSRRMMSRGASVSVGDIKRASSYIISPVIVLNFF